MNGYLFYQFEDHNRMRSNNLLLKNGSRIAIIGGGPAGSFFAHFASRYAKRSRY